MLEKITICFGQWLEEGFDLENPLSFFHIMCLIGGMVGLFIWCIVTQSVTLPLTVICIGLSVFVPIVIWFLDRTIIFITEGDHHNVIYDKLFPREHIVGPALVFIWASIALTFIAPFELVVFYFPGAMPYVWIVGMTIGAYVAIVLIARKLYKVGKKLNNHIRDKAVHK